MDFFIIIMKWNEENKIGLMIAIYLDINYKNKKIFGKGKNIRIKKMKKKI